MIRREYSHYENESPTRDFLLLNISAIRNSMVRLATFPPPPEPALPCLSPAGRLLRKNFTAAPTSRSNLAPLGFGSMFKNERTSGKDLLHRNRHSPEEGKFHNCAGLQGQKDETTCKNSRTSTRKEAISLA